MDGSIDGKEPAHNERARDVLSLFSSVGMAGVAVVASLLGLVPTLRILTDSSPLSRTLSWDAAHGPFVIGLDALSAFFLVPVLGLSLRTGWGTS